VGSRHGGRGGGHGGSSTDDDPCISEDGLELYFASDRAGGLGNADIWRIQRASIGSSWSAPEAVLALSSPSRENTPALSRDALTMWLSSDRAGDPTDEDIYVATRTTRTATWSTPVRVAELASGTHDRGPSLYDDDRAMVFHAGGTNMTSRRTTTTTTWSAPEPLGVLGYRPWMSPCALEIVVQIGADPDFAIARRAAVTEPFGPLEPIVELSSAAYDQDLRLSPDRRHAYLASDRDGRSRIYEASR